MNSGSPLAETLPATASAPPVTVAAGDAVVRVGVVG